MIKSLGFICMAQLVMYGAFVNLQHLVPNFICWNRLGATYCV